MKNIFSISVEKYKFLSVVYVYVCVNKSNAEQMKQHSLAPKMWTFLMLPLFCQVGLITLHVIQQLHYMDHSSIPLLV